MAQLDTLASQTQLSIEVEKTPSGGQLFQIGDRLRAKAFGVGSTIIANNWFEVIGNPQDKGDSHSYPVNQVYGSSATFAKGTAIVNYRQEGDGFIKLTSDEGGDDSILPYISVETTTATPWDGNIPHVWIGNLDGVSAAGSTPPNIQWGFIAGSDLSDPTQPHVIVSDQQVALKGVAQSWYAGTVESQNLRGVLDPNATGASSFFWLMDGDGNKKLDFTAGGDLTIEGSITITNRGTIPLSDFDNDLDIPDDAEYVVWHSDVEFSPGSTPSTQVQWTAGTIYFGNGGTQSIDASPGSVSVAAGGTYFFCRPGNSTLQSTTDPKSGSVPTAGDILVAVVKQGSPNVSIKVVIGDTYLDAGWINVPYLSAFSADIGLVTAGQIELFSSGSLSGNDATGMVISESVTYDNKNWHLLSLNNGIRQVGIDTDAALYAGAGHVKLGSGGIEILTDTAAINPGSINLMKWDGSTRIGRLYGLSDVWEYPFYTRSVVLEATDEGTVDSSAVTALVQATTPGDKAAVATLRARQSKFGGSSARVTASTGEGYSRVIVEDELRVLDRLYIGGTGTAPAEKLHIYGGSASTLARVRIQGGGDISSGEVCGLQLYKGTTLGGNWRLDADGTVQFASYNGKNIHFDSDGECRFYPGGTHQMTVRTGTGGVSIASQLRIGSTGTPGTPLDMEVNHVGVMAHLQNNGSNDNRQGMLIQAGAWTNPTSSCNFILFRSASGTAIGAVHGNGAGGVNYHTESDARYKSIVSDLAGEDALTALRSAVPIRYRGLGTPEGPVIVGFRAQDLAECTEGVVFHNADTDRYSMDYGLLTPYLWAGWQYHQERIVALETQIEKLEAQLDK